MRILGRLALQHWELDFEGPLYQANLTYFDRWFSLFKQLAPWSAEQRLLVRLPIWREAYQLELPERAQSLCIKRASELDALFADLVQLEIVVRAMKRDLQEVLV